MSRSKPKVSFDDLNRIIKAALRNGLTISRISFDGTRLDVVVGEPGEGTADLNPELIRVPTL